MYRRVAQLGILSLLVALLALIQNRLMVQQLGAGATVDAYYLAQTLPMAVVTVLGTASLSLFVPLFARPGAAVTLEGSLGLGLAVSAIIALGMVLQWPVSVLLGFWKTGDGALWMAFVVAGAVAYGLSFYLRALVVAAEHAEVFLVAQVLNALLFIGLLAAGFVRDLVTLAAGFCAGAVLQLVLVAGWLVRTGRYDARPATMPPGLSDCLKAGVAASLGGVAFMQAATAVDRWFAESLGQGVVTTYYMADRMVQMVIVLVATAIGLVVFPRMAVEEGGVGSRVTAKSVHGLVAFLAPLASVVWVYALPITAFLFGGGEFGADAIAQSGGFLEALAFGLLPMGVVVVVPRRLQATGRWRVYLLTAATLFVVNFVLKYVLVRAFGTAGLAPATVVAYAVAAATYLGYLTRRGLMSFEKRELRDMAVTLLLALSHAVALSFVPSVAAVVWFAPVSFGVLWFSAAAMGGHVERETLRLVGKLRRAS